MKASMELLVRGLLLLALGGFAVGCGDDSDAGGKTDAAVDSGTPDGGTGGSKPSVDAGGNTGTPAGMCVANTTNIVGDFVPAACVSCACTMAETVTIACDALCWSLIGCVVEMCSDATSDEETSACVFEKCPQFVPGAIGAMALGQTLSGVCLDACRGPSSEDAGVDTDAGN